MVGERMFEAFASLQITNKEVAAEMGVSPQYISNLKKYDGINKLIVGIAKKYRINLEWLKSGNGRMFENNEVSKLVFDTLQIAKENNAENEFNNLLAQFWVQQKISKVFKDKKNEMGFYKYFFDMMFSKEGPEGRRDIGTLQYLKKVLEPVCIPEITSSNAKQILLEAIEDTKISVKEKVIAVGLGSKEKSELKKLIDGLDDLSCYIILANSKVVLEEIDKTIKELQKLF